MILCLDINSLPPSIFGFSLLFSKTSWFLLPFQISHTANIKTWFHGVDLLHVWFWRSNYKINHSWRSEEKNELSEWCTPKWCQIFLTTWQSRSACNMDSRLLLQWGHAVFTNIPLAWRHLCSDACISIRTFESWARCLASIPLHTFTSHSLTHYYSMLSLSKLSVIIRTFTHIDTNTHTYIFVLFLLKVEEIFSL